MTNVMDGLPERVRSLLTEIVGQRDPELLAALLESKEPKCGNGRECRRNGDVRAGLGRVDRRW